MATLDLSWQSGAIDELPQQALPYMSHFTSSAIHGGLIAFKQFAEREGFTVRYYYDVVTGHWLLVVPPALKESQAPLVQYGLRELAKVDEVTIHAESGDTKTTPDLE